MIWLAKVLHCLLGLDYVAVKYGIDHHIRLVLKINGKRYVKLYGMFYELDSRNYFYITPEPKS